MPLGLAQISVAGLSKGVSNKENNRGVVSAKVALPSLMLMKCSLEAVRRQCPRMCKVVMAQPMTTLAPSFPSTPRSFGLGLLARPFFRFRKPNTPPEASGLPPRSLLTPLASAGSVASWRANSLQLPPPSSVTWTPPVGLVAMMLGPPAPVRPPLAEFV